MARRRGLVTGILSFLFSSFVVGLIARGFGEVVHNFTGIPVETVIIVGTLPVIAYAALGGVENRHPPPTQSSSPLCRYPFRW